MNFRFSCCPLNRLKLNHSQGFVTKRIHLPSFLIHKPNVSSLRFHSTHQDKRDSIATLPNALTLFRIGLSPFIGNWIVNGQYEAALIGVAVAGLTDLLDGWIARSYNAKTVLGSVLDPMADKILMTVLTVSLAKASLLPSNEFN